MGELANGHKTALSHLARRSAHRFVKRVTLTIIRPNGRLTKQVFRAPAGRAFTEKGIDDMVESYANAVEKSYPDTDFKLIELSPGEFKFVAQPKEIDQ